MNLKSLPLTELEVIAVIYQCDEDVEGKPIFELEVFNDEAHARAEQAGLGRVTRCDCCGHQLKYACVVEHKPSQQFYQVGRQCAFAMDALKNFKSTVDNASLAMAQRAACNEREQSWLATNPDGRETLMWGKAGISKIAEDLAGKLRTYGLSDKQTAFFKKLHADDQANRAAATGVAPTGRQTISGVVLSVKLTVVPARTRYDKDSHVAKVLVDLGNGAKVYGNAPGATVTEYPFACSVEKGQHVQFTATFEPSSKDPLFGFWKRPTKWEVVMAGEAVAA